MPEKCTAPTDPLNEMSVEMYSQHTNAATLQHTGAPGDRGNAGRVVQIGGAVCTLQYLSTGYLSGGHRCERVIPEAVAGDRRLGSRARAARLRLSATLA